MQDIPLVIAPDPDEPEAAEVLIDGTVDGRQRRFLLDTGAARSRLVADPHTADLAIVSTEASHGAVAGTTDELVRISELAVGPLRAQELEVIRVPAEQPGARDLLGMDVLARACCRVDLAQQRLRIEVSPHPHAGQPLIMDERDHQASWLFDFPARRWSLSPAARVNRASRLRGHVPAVSGG
jgi:hypothetical protein